MSWVKFLKDCKTSKGFMPKDKEFDCPDEHQVKGWKDQGLAVSISAPMQVGPETGEMHLNLAAMSPGLDQIPEESPQPRAFETMRSVLGAASANKTPTKGTGKKK
jgi:hypothetical protein